MRPVWIPQRYPPQRNNCERWCGMRKSRVRMLLAMSVIVVGLLFGGSMRAFGYGAGQYCVQGMVVCPGGIMCHAPGHCGIAAPHKCITNTNFGTCTPAYFGGYNCVKPAGCTYQEYTPMGMMNMCAVATFTFVNPLCHGECL